MLQSLVCPRGVSHTGPDVRFGFSPKISTTVEKTVEIKDPSQLSGLKPEFFGEFVGAKGSRCLPGRPLQSAAAREYVSFSLWLGESPLFWPFSTVSR